MRRWTYENPKGRSTVLFAACYYNKRQQCYLTTNAILNQARYLHTFNSTVSCISFATRPFHLHAESDHFFSTSPSPNSMSRLPGMSALSVAGLVLVAVAFFLCGMLISLYIWRQTRSRHLAIQYQHCPSLLEKRQLRTPATPTSLQHYTKACGATATTQLSSSQWYAQATVTDEYRTHNAFSTNQSADVLTAIRPARLQNYKQVDSVIESPIDRESPFQLKRASARRFSSDLERAWPQLLPPAQTEQEGLLERLLWRNSSGGSSCYSRPSSWYSVAGTEQSEEATNCGFRAGSGPTTRIDQALAHRQKALPPVPTTKE